MQVVFAPLYDLDDEIETFNYFLKNKLHVSFSESKP